MAGEVEVAVLTADFDARAEHVADLAAVLARYVVLTRGEPGCRNVDLLSSATESGRFLVIEKWDSAEAARSHLDTELMTGMAAAAVPLLAQKPRIDLLDTISAHDLA
jgi:quinol monooxygenase YgiN